MASALPAAWVESDQTGRDYGNDLTVELFDDGRPTASELDLQIKGRDAAWAVESELRTQFPVKTLLYAEQRSVPFLAAICPIQELAPTFGFAHPRQGLWAGSGASSVTGPAAQCELPIRGHSRAS